MTAHIAKCSSCGRPIIWATSPTGARLPLSAKPVTAYSLPDADLPPLAIKLETASPVYISHFVDCPNATQHSRKGALS